MKDLKSDIVTKTKIRKLKKKKNVNFNIGDRIAIVEELNRQYDRAEIEAKVAAMTYIVR